ncbi:MAG: OsmC family protein [Elusimicrobiales bacterium]
MELELSFPGGKQVSARVRGHSILSDQPQDNGGQDAAPTPLELFAASLASCSSLYAVAFLQRKGIDTTGVSARATAVRDEQTHLITKFTLEFSLPPGFSEELKAQMVRAAQGCLVAKHFEKPPVIEVK